MTTNDGIIFGIMVFVAVVLLASAMIVPTAGTAAQASRKMRKRIGKHLELQDPGVASMLRNQYLGELSPIERSIERLPFLQSLSRAVEQSGVRTSAAKIILNGVLLGLIGFVVATLLLSSALIGIMVAFVLFWIPIVSLLRKRAVRMNRFEEQLPEALDIMARALKAGHPFTETLNLVAEEMQEPIAGEFGRIFSDLNFGMPLKAAFQSVLMRVPSMSLHTVVTAVLIQSETGGALAEILDNVAGIIRGRFKLQRKLKTLSAEGRMSAWILALIPFALAIALELASPGYLEVLIKDPLGKKLILSAFFMMIVGVFWIRSVIRIEV